MLADVPAIVELIAADQIGATRDGGDLAPYERAFAAIDADPAQLLVVAAGADRHRSSLKPSCVALKPNRP